MSRFQLIGFLLFSLFLSLNLALSAMKDPNIINYDLKEVFKYYLLLLDDLFL